MPLKTVKARRASIRNCCGKKRFCRTNNGIEKGDASDERELFEDEHLIVLCEKIVENKWKEIMMNDGFSRDWSDRNHFSDGSSKRTDFSSLRMGENRIRL